MLPGFVSFVSFLSGFATLANGKYRHEEVSREVIMRSSKTKAE